MKLLTIIVPVFQEEKNIPILISKITAVIDRLHHFTWEVIFVNDGSEDRSQFVLEKFAHNDPRIKIIEFSRNFGKELATSSGISECKGEACIILDADLQHPPELFIKFIEKWENGAEVVVGVRNQISAESPLKKVGSWLFYNIFNLISDVKLIPNSCDYRLLDRKVINQFVRFSEKNRITRALIDWLGFRRDYVFFDAPERIHGNASYSLIKLFRLAFTSFISLSLFPLKFAGYIGIFIFLLSGGLGLFVFFEKYIFHDSLRLSISGTAILAIIILFLVGIILTCLGLIALYIADIHREVIDRPIYVIRSKTNFKEL